MVPPLPLEPTAVLANKAAICSGQVDAISHLQPNVSCIATAGCGRQQSSTRIGFQRVCNDLNLTCFAVSSVLALI
jgi:hypothetical protein